MKKLQNDHFQKINISDFIYILNPNGYIGTMVTAEIGYSFGKGKPIYFMEKTNRFKLDAMATGFINRDELNNFLLL